MFDGRNLDYQWEEVFATVIEEFDSKGAVPEMPTLRPSDPELVNTAALQRIYRVRPADLGNFLEGDFGGRLADFWSIVGPDRRIVMGWSAASTQSAVGV